MRSGGGAKPGAPGPRRRPSPPPRTPCLPPPEATREVGPRRPMGIKVHWHPKRQMCEDASTSHARRGGPGGPGVGRRPKQSVPGIRRKFAGAFRSLSNFIPWDEALGFRRRQSDLNQKKASPRCLPLVRAPPPPRGWPPPPRGWPPPPPPPPWRTARPTPAAPRPRCARPPRPAPRAGPSALRRPSSSPSRRERPPPMAVAQRRLREPPDRLTPLPHCPNPSPSPSSPSPPPLVVAPAERRGREATTDGCKARRSGSNPPPACTGAFTPRDRRR